MRKSKYVFNPFGKCNSPTDMEVYLKKMSRLGWIPKKITYMSDFMIKFIRTEKREKIYGFDSCIVNDEEYQSSYKTLGWTYLGKMDSINIWYKEKYQEYDEESSIFKEKKIIQKSKKSYELMYKKRMQMLYLCSIVFFPMIVFSIYFFIIEFLFFMQLAYILKRYNKIKKAK